MTLPTSRVVAAVALGVAGVLAVSAPGAAGAAVPTSQKAGTSWERVVVSGQPHAIAAVERALAKVAARDVHPLKVINGASATVRADRLAVLRKQPGVRSVSADSTGKLMGLDPALGYDVGADTGSLYNIAQVTHAKDAWSHGWTGLGIDVALIDSGVAPVQGLTSGNVVNGPDLSFESQDPDLRYLDTFGHGTHMASIIVGRDKAATGTWYAKADSHTYNGIAPDARLISLKVASSDGAADVSQVIAAIDWVTQHASDPGMNIRVLNLSYGTNGTQSPETDPLDYAVENAWHAGIVVVVSSGNDGTSSTVLANPAQDPLVIAVGADDPRTTDSVGDDQVPAFSQRGTTARHVDVIAPGLHVLGLRDPGSRIDQDNPSAVVNGRFFRGSGTSQAAAVVSGLAALYLNRFPGATPDQVKKALMTNAVEPTSVKPLFAGLGVPDVNKAIGVKPPVYVQPGTGATGTGSLEGARGSAHVNDGTSDLTGERDIFGQAWDGPTWAAASAAHTAWTGGVWNGTAMTGDDWSAASWAGSSWTSHMWTGSDWDSHAWTSHAWTSHMWTSSGWDSHAWTDLGWTGNAWSSKAWSAASWS